MLSWEWIMCGGHVTVGRWWAETDGAAAALGPKARSGIHFPPNPLVGSAATGVWEGLGLV
jgi:hypothetical protein